MLRELSEGGSPEATRAAIDENAERHGTTVKRFEER
jgi:hypothetical protein